MSTIFQKLLSCLRLKKQENPCPTSLEKNTSFQELLAAVKLDCGYFHNCFSQRRDDLQDYFIEKVKQGPEITSFIELEAAMEIIKRLDYPSSAYRNVYESIKKHLRNRFHEMLDEMLGPRTTEDDIQRNEFGQALERLFQKLNKG